MVSDSKTEPIPPAIRFLPADRYLICQNCGITFVRTGWEQKQDPAEPEHCSGCRHVLALTQRRRGAVKWYDKRKGFGFITASDGSEVFVHRQALGQVRSLRRGDVVAFRIEQGEAGAQATEVERLQRTKRRGDRRVAQSTTNRQDA